jgi:large subunit ribosomal protein L13
MQTQKEHPVIINADSLILGRMATVVAKRLLQGQDVTILNAEKAVISGKRLSKVKEAKGKLQIGHPRKGPYYAKRPDRYVKRSIRGMLPRKKPKGLAAYRRLKVFIGVPEALRDKDMTSISIAKAEKLKCPYLTVGELVQEIGWTPTGE